MSLKITGRKKLSDFPFDESVGESFDHSKWDQVLKRHVKVVRDIVDIDMVDYDGVAEDSDFLSYLVQLGRLFRRPTFVD